MLATDKFGDGTARIDDPDNIVQAQVCVHELSSSAPGTMGADIDADNATEHANLHIGELHWDDNGMSGNPAEPGVSPTPILTVEVDYVSNKSWSGGGSPFDITNGNGVALTTAIERNYALYGIDLDLIESDNITDRELEDVVIQEDPSPMPPPARVTPDGLNRIELGAIEDDFHNDDSRLHMLWGPPLRNDTPQSPIDRRTDFSQSAGVAWHVGSPDGPLVKTIESDFGIMIARDEYRPTEYHGLQSVAMHELGHALSVGWADDAPVPVPFEIVGEKAFEVYSGDPDPGPAGGTDVTPENVTIMNPSASTTTPRWSIMRSGRATDSRRTGISGRIPVLLFSIEEVSTLDIEDVPSRK